MGTASANVADPDGPKFTAGCACSGLYRSLKFWEAAEKEADPLNQNNVIKALDHAKIAEGPGGPAEMVRGQHYARMNMYITQASGGSSYVVQNLEVIEPRECMQGIKQENQGRVDVISAVLSDSARYVRCQ